MFRACFGKPQVASRGRQAISAPSNVNVDIPQTREDVESARSASRVQVVEQVCHTLKLQVDAAVQGSRSAQGHTSGGNGQVQSGASSAIGHSAANASRIRSLQAEDVTVCDVHTILNGLRLKHQELGRGTYGIVISGTYRGVPCAVKVMLSKGIDRAAVRELLLGPALVHPNTVLTYSSRCATLTHEFFDFLEGGSRMERSPNLPRVLEPLPDNSEEGFGDPKGVEDGTDPINIFHQLLHALGAETSMLVVVVIQEHCNRGTLDRAIRRSVFRPSPSWSHRLARRALLRTATEAARGLLHLHDSGVVHGDFKPANVLLSRSDEDRRGFVAKVADFGLSHVLPLAVNSISTECTGSIAYMAPEAFNGKVSRATDVWAVGVCLWEMLTGKRPYEDAQCAVTDVTRQITEGRLVLRWPDAPGDASLVTLGKRCLSHNPQDRPTMPQVVEELVGIERAFRAELLAWKAQQKQLQKEQEQRQQRENEQQLQQPQVQRLVERGCMEVISMEASSNLLGEQQSDSVVIQELVVL